MINSIISLTIPSQKNIGAPIDESVATKSQQYRVSFERTLAQANEISNENNSLGEKRASTSLDCLSSNLTRKRAMKTSFISRQSVLSICAGEPVVEVIDDGARVVSEDL